MFVGSVKKVQISTVVNYDPFDEKFDAFDNILIDITSII
jgi:hypothetical protein